MKRLSAVGLAVVLLGAAGACGDEVTTFPTGTTGPGGTGGMGLAGPGGDGPDGGGGEGPMGGGGQGPGGGGQGGGSAMCGDGSIDGAEDCDDANTANGDGCSDACTVEAGWSCTGRPSVCTSCGDFVVSPPEECDDGNAVSGDGCSDVCAFEATCGNMAIEPGEECDDGNNTQGDGCDNCSLEPGTACGDAVDLNDPGNVTIVDGSVVYAGDSSASMLVDYSNPSCGNGGTGGVPTVLHQYVTQTPGFLLIETTATMGGFPDTVVWAVTDCQAAAPEIACSDDDGPGQLSQAITDFLPAGTTVFVVVSGWQASDVGLYTLQLTELPHEVVPSSGTCMMPTAVGNGGSFSGGTLMGDPDNMVLTCATGGGAPDAVFELTLAGDANVFAQVQPLQPFAWDAVIALLDSSCSPLGMGELACDNDLNNDEFLETLAAGTYYIVVDGSGGADFGQYSLTVDIQEILPQGSPCDPTEADNVCEPGLLCLGPMGMETCTQPLLADDFSNGLGAYTITDSAMDMQTWRQCIPNMGCVYGNFTGSASQGAFGLVADAGMAPMAGEILATAMLDATGLATVILEVDTIFDDEPNCDDEIAIETSTDGMSWSSAFGQAGMDLAAQRLQLDLSMAVAGGPFFVRFRYTDSIAMAPCLAQEWRIDDLLIYGF
jgi:cysteine-rich repeat protein